MKEQVDLNLELSNTIDQLNTELGLSKETVESLKSSIAQLTLEQINFTRQMEELENSHQNKIIEVSERHKSEIEKMLGEKDKEFDTLVDINQAEIEQLNTKL